MPISQEHLAGRLRAAREHVGMTQAEAAVAVDLPRTALVQIENGNRAVSSLELAHLAQAYAVSITSLLSEAEEPDAFAALFRSDDPKAERASILAAIQKYAPLARAATDLERQLGIDVATTSPAVYAQPTPRSTMDAVRQGEQVAAAERARLGLGHAPIADVESLLESQGVRAGRVHLPDGISGLVLAEPSIGLLVAVNAGHHGLRRRFSFAHEYAHVLLDRERRGLVSRVADGADLVEARANAFAAAFLLPPEGVRAAIVALGKGETARPTADVVDSQDHARLVEGRRAPGSQDVQLYDVVHLAHAFGVSRVAAIYRLTNLGFLRAPQADALREQESARGKKLASQLGLAAETRDAEATSFEHRFLALALEAYRRELITRAKLEELVRLADKPRTTAKSLIDAAGLKD